MGFRIFIWVFYILPAHGVHFFVGAAHQFYEADIETDRSQFAISSGLQAKGNVGKDDVLMSPTSAGIKKERRKSFYALNSKFEIKF